MAIVDTLIVGAGQAGLALSHHLTGAGHDHVLIERGRVGERWRSERWDSLRLLTPNWLNRLPGSPPHADADGFLTRDAVVAYLERYARSFGAPALEETAVRRIERFGSTYRVRTSNGTWCARSVVVATGDCAVPAIPRLAAQVPRGMAQLSVSTYRSPQALAPGGVLVVGAGPSGQQIALELRRAGRDVVLAVGRHARMVRRYRDREIWEWLAELGELSRTIDEVPDPAAARRAPSLPLSGTGENIDLSVLADAGVVVAGRLVALEGSRATFADDLEATVADADRRMRRVLGNIDERAGETPAVSGVPPVRLPVGPASVDLQRAGIGTVIWATGFRRAYPWLRVPVLDAGGDIDQHHGRTASPGLLTLGLRFQHRRGSHFIGGVGRDAEDLAELLADRSGGRARRWAA